MNTTRSFGFGFVYYVAIVLAYLLRDLLSSSFSTETGVRYRLITHTHIDSSVSDKAHWSQSQWSWNKQVIP